jgi:hypothetical protein
MIMEYTHDEYYMLLAVGAVQLVQLHGNTGYVTLVDVIQTLMCFEDWNEQRLTSVTPTAL